MKFRENFAKHEINYFWKISRNYKKENFCSNPTPTQSAVCCTNYRLLKHSFAAWQCFFEMKPIYTPQYSILSSLILWKFVTFYRTYTSQRALVGYIYCILYTVQQGASNLVFLRISKRRIRGMPHQGFRGGKFFFFLHHPPIYAGSLKFADFENFHSPRKKYF